MTTPSLRLAGLWLVTPRHHRGSCCSDLGRVARRDRIAISTSSSSRSTSITGSTRWCACATRLPTWMSRSTSSWCHAKRPRTDSAARARLSGVRWPKVGCWLSPDREQAELLLRKAVEDQAVLVALAENPEIADAALGFHAQQAVEKALKAVLAARGDDFPWTHDLQLLLR